MFIEKLELNIIGYSLITGEKNEKEIFDGIELTLISGKKIILDFDELKELKLVK